MKGFVPTPAPLVDRMVSKLFERRPPTASSRILDPGCGSGAFVEGVVRWCRSAGADVPRITAVDSDPARVAEALAAVGHLDPVTVSHRDFLGESRERFDYIIANPPYVPITGLSPDERARYRAAFDTASGRFDLYLLFFERALDVLAPGGRLVFVTPEKFLYVRSAAPLRRRLATVDLEEIELIAEDSFPGRVTYPAITTVNAAPRCRATHLVARDGTGTEATLAGDGGSWIGAFARPLPAAASLTLDQAFVRISCGVATGADDVFVVPDHVITADLREFAHPTLSGRELGAATTRRTGFQMLIPYDRSGTLLPESRLGALRGYLRNSGRYERLMRRTCVRRKPWYAFHETPPLADIHRPKILCKDIASRPRFVVDQSGAVVPRHSLYYLVPRDPTQCQELCEYLNSDEVAMYLQARCQRAANGYLRVQSHVLRSVPLPGRFVPGELAL